MPVGRSRTGVSQISSLLCPTAIVWNDTIAFPQTAIWRHDIFLENFITPPRPTRQLGNQLLQSLTSATQLCPGKSPFFLVQPIKKSILVDLIGPCSIPALQPVTLFQTFRLVDGTQSWTSEIRNGFARKPRSFSSYACRKAGVPQARVYSRCILGYCALLCMTTSWLYGRQMC